MDLKTYYETYWTRDTDVSENDVTTPERRQRLLRELRRHCEPGAIVLDLGCGAGSFACEIQQAGYDAVGMDLSEKAVAFARRRHPHVRFEVLHADGTIPAPDRTFAAVWSSEVIEHVFDVGAYLREIHRVLQPNGLLVLTTPHHGLIKNLGIVLVKFERHFNVQGNHIRYFTKPALDRCLTEGGFQPLAYGGVGRFWPVYRTWFVTAKRAA